MQGDGVRELLAAAREMGCDFLENEPMRLHTTFKIGGPARLFVQPADRAQLCRAVALCKAQGVPVLLHCLPGRNDTVRLGLSALLEQQPELSGCMFLPGDQPLLHRETVEAMTERFCHEQPSPAEWQKETEREIFRLGAVADNLSLIHISEPTRP